MWTPIHLALAGELAHRGPARFPYVASESLAYHWFSHAWVAQVATASGTGLDEVLLRFQSAITPFAVASAGAAAVRLTGRARTGPVAALLTLSGGDLNVFGRVTPGFPIAPPSPGDGLSAVLVIALVLLLGAHWQRALRPGGRLLLPLLTFRAAGTKGSTIPVVVAGLGLATVAMAVFNRTRLRTVLTDLGVVAASLSVAVVVVFKGGSSGPRIDPHGALWATPAALWLRGEVRSVQAAAHVAAVTVAAAFTERQVLVEGWADTQRATDSASQLRLHTRWVDVYELLAPR